MILQKIKNSHLFRSAFIYGASSAINGAIPFLLLPVLTRYLSPADYGLVTVFTTLISFYNVFVGLNINGAIFNKYFFSKNHPNFNFDEYISNSLYLLIFSSLFVLLTTFIFISQIETLTQLPMTWIFVAASTSIFQYFILIRLAIYQAQAKAKNYAFLIMTQSSFNVLFSLLLVLFYNLNWTGRALGITFSLYAVGIYSLFRLAQQYRITWALNNRYLKDLLSFGLPLVPHTLGAILISLADRFIITKLVNLSEAGLYQAGLQVSMILLFFTEAFNKAYSPWLYSALQKNDPVVKTKIVRFTYIYFIFILSAALILSLIPEEIFVFIIGEKFRNSKVFIFWSSMAFAFNGMYLMVCNYIFYSEKTKYLAYITLPTGLLNIGLSYFLIQKIGPIGAAISMALSYFLMFVLTWYRSAKLIQMPWFQLKANTNE